nr:immunoglobulin light chain junction region [Macaca mulatta]MOX17462.1 immunoglobulin light chain junction region [Macaca mulatta]MOX17482.1 immunoglobulin light chain junction region [Macaca mulatta]MOX19081.1 immunoglobulin light chain junction region [Macaca mulatta]MOX19585.1 immunoglobulin light chain junction region [Macaca mulatta]
DYYCQSHDSNQKMLF